MTTELFWIPTTFPGRLAMAPRPRGGDWLDDEIAGWQRAGIDLIVSMLTSDESTELNLDGEPVASAALGIGFRSLPIPDRDVPASRPEFRELVDEIVRELVAGRRIVIHCRQGIGRAGMVAAGVLIASGISAEAAVATVSVARRRPLPDTAEQRRWLDDFAKEALIPVGVTGGQNEDEKG